MAKLYYQGHGSFRITLDDRRVIYVDPFAGDGYDRSADIVLITHEHRDHNRLELLRLKENAVVLRAEDLLIDREYQMLDLDGFMIQAVPAYNKNHSKDQCVGLLMIADGVCVYASGDTSTTGYMSAFLSRMPIDYALFCCDGVYNMDAQEAAHCAKVVGAKHNIPVHTMADTAGIFNRANAEGFDAPGRLILEPGEEIELVK